jgi:hypothetical protein
MLQFYNMLGYKGLAEVLNPTFKKEVMALNTSRPLVVNPSEKEI